jgi:hypothetical protein
VWKYAPSKVGDAGFKKIWARHERVGATPAAATALMQMNQEIDISGVLSAIRVPTLVIHRTEDTAVSIEAGRFLAQHIPRARLAEFAGADHLPYIGENSGDIADEIQEFVTGSRPVVEADRVLATVMITDKCLHLPRPQSVNFMAHEVDQLGPLDRLLDPGHRPQVRWDVVLPDARIDQHRHTPPEQVWTSAVQGSSFSM